MDKKTVIKERQPNFELLRCLAMFSIIIWHSISHGIMEHTVVDIETPTHFFNYGISQILLSLCCVSVNVYVMITGYFLYDKGFRLDRMSKIWFQTFFYSLIIAIFFFLVLPSYGVESFSLRKLLPYWGGAYWFVVDYLVLLVVAPFLSKASCRMDKKTYDFLILVIIVIGCSLFPFQPGGNHLHFYYGYSLVWFVCLYITGCYLRRFSFNFTRNQLLIVSIGIIFIVSSFGFVYSSMTGGVKLMDPVYNAISTYLQSIIIFVFFKNLELKYSLFTRVLLYISPLTFAVYLIHDNPYVRDVLWNILPWQKLYDDELLIIYVILFSLLIFVICILTDLVRRWLFRILTIDKIIKSCSIYIEENIRQKLSKIND